MSSPLLSPNGSDLILVVCVWLLSETSQRPLLPTNEKSENEKHACSPQLIK